MAEFREERVSTERVVNDPVVERDVAVDPVRRGNPAPVIAAICIALLLAFLVWYGMSRNNSNDDTGDDGVRVTVPRDLDQNDGNDGGSGSSSDGSNDAETDTNTKTETSTNP